MRTTFTSRLRAVAVLVLLVPLLGLGGVAVAWQGQAAGPGRVPAKGPAADGPAPERVKRVDVGKNVAVELGGGKPARVLVRARVCLREGVLEQLLTRKGTKEHEAILAADVDARAIHTALLLAGADAGLPVRHRPKFAPPTGTVVRITLEYTDAAGKLVRVPARQWVRHVKTKKDLGHDWVFAGSHLEMDLNDPAKVRYLANDGSLVCVANFETALLDLPVASSNQNDDLDFEAHRERIPRLNTPVLVILEPVVARKGGRQE